MTGCFNTFYLKGEKTRQKLKLYLVKKQQSLILSGGGNGYVCGLENVHVLSEFRHKCGVVLFLS